MLPLILMCSPDHYEVSYSINPWMKPAAWAADREGSLAKARAEWSALVDQLRASGADVEVMPGQPGLPDMVFTANGAIVLDGKVLPARFRYPERQGEEPWFRQTFEDLRDRGLVKEIGALPAGALQEGTGDCIWDESRHLFWAGFGPRSNAASIPAIRAFFGAEVVPLELATDRFYHLDTCFRPLPGGEIVYFPPAFRAESLERLAARVPPEQRIEARAEEAGAFSINAVPLGRDIVMATPPARLRGLLEERDYHCRAVDLQHFMLSGGGAFCLTLRLDQGR